MLGSLSLSSGKRAHEHALSNHRAQNPQVMNRDSNLYDLGGLNTVERVIFVGANFSYHYEVPISNICTAQT